MTNSETTKRSMLNKIPKVLEMEFDPGDGDLRPSQHIQELRDGDIVCTYALVKVERIKVHKTWTREVMEID